MSRTPVTLDRDDALESSFRCVWLDHAPTPQASVDLRKAGSCESGLKARPKTKGGGGKWRLEVTFMICLGGRGARRLGSNASNNTAGLKDP